MADGIARDRHEIGRQVRERNMRRREQGSYAGRPVLGVGRESGHRRGLLRLRSHRPHQMGHQRGMRDTSQRKGAFGLLSPTSSEGVITILNLDPKMIR